MPGNCRPPVPSVTGPKEENHAYISRKFANSNSQIRYVCVCMCVCVCVCVCIIRDLTESRSRSIYHDTEHWLKVGRTLSGGPSFNFHSTGIEITWIDCDRGLEVNGFQRFSSRNLVQKSVKTVGPVPIILQFAVCTRYIFILREKLLSSHHRWQGCMYTLYWVRAHVHKRQAPMLWAYRVLAF